MKSPALVELLARWGARAEEHARVGSLAPVANVVRDLMAELEAATRAEDDELLNVSQASKETGFSDRTIRQYIADGKLENHGRRNAPKLRRGDLPRKTTAKTTAPAAYDVAADALALVRRG